MSGSFRVEFRNKYGRIRRAHMSASPRFSQFDVYILYLYHYGTDGRKERGTRARVAENDVPFHRSARHWRKAALQMNPWLYKYFGMININSYAITCQMYQFLSVRGEHSFRYMTDAIFIDINKSFIDINKYGIVNHIYWYQ